MEEYVFLQVAVFGLASRPSFPRDPSDDSCLPNSLVPATFEASLFFSSFVDNLQQEDGKGKNSRNFSNNIMYKLHHILCFILMINQLTVHMFCISASTNHSLGFQTAFEMIENMIRRSKGVTIGRISDKPSVTWLMQLTMGYN